MRFTIERLRTLVLVAGVLLVGALVLFLAIGKWRNPLNLKELPKKLGIDIQSDATSFTMERAFGDHSRYKIHASKAVQYKQGTAILRDVKIELFGADGSRVDRIEGAEFEYDQKAGKAVAKGPVEITLMRPGVTPAIAKDAPIARPPVLAGKEAKGKATPLSAAAETAARGEIHVKTSGLSFDEKNQVATTSEHVDFSMAQGSGTATGATYDAKLGVLVLDRAVELNAVRGGQTVVLHAQHAEFQRDDKTCRLHAASADYRGGEATAGDASVLFREDGSAVRLDAMNGFTMATSTGGHMTAPKGTLDFNERNQPRHGRLEGGVTMDDARPPANGAGERQVHGTSPVVELDFTPRGQLRHAHMERGVEIHSEELSDSAGGELRSSRIWKSPLADVDFRDNGHGKVEPASMHGTDGVVLTGLTQRGQGVPVPSRLAADEVTGAFGPNAELKTMTGTGHAAFEESTVSGTRQTATGDRLVAQFVPSAAGGANQAAEKLPSEGGGGFNPRAKPAQATGALAPEGSSVTCPENRPLSPACKAAPPRGGAAQIQSAVLEGHVVLVQEPAAKPGSQAPAPMRAMAGRAAYDGAGEWVHLTLGPRVDDGGLQVTADKIDVSHESGDAFAHGNVKATWQGNGSAAGNAAAGKSGSVSLGGQGPTHVIASEAQLHQATGQATFRGHARLWQQVNSVSGPVIVLDQERQTLVASTTDAAEPVKAVLVSAGGSAAPSGRDTSGKPHTPSVVRVRGGDLKYSDAERKAVMHGGVLGSVTAETPTATSTSSQVELVLLPPGNHAGPDGGQSPVDRMTATGHVVVSSAGRRGTGEQLVYTGETGEYVLTGTAAAPPRMTDPARGSVTGEALIFHSRDDSVSIEGGGKKTTTQTTAPK